DEKLLERLDGRPVQVDPGEHVFTFATKDGRVVQEPRVIRAGERAAIVSVVLPPSAGGELSEGAHRTGIPVGAYLLGALSVGAAVVGTTRALTGLHHESELRAGCAPRCSTDDVEGLHRQYIVADVFFGVAIVGAALTAWLVVSARKVPSAGATYGPGVTGWQA